jgi:thioredoxin-like negative regulator of GroEL
MPVENISSALHLSEYVKKHKVVLALYYWKQCGYCQMLVPTWNKVIQKHIEKINVMHIEWDIIKKFDKKNMVSVFPTIVIFKNGVKVAEMNKERNEKNLNQFINDNILKPKSVKKQTKKTKKPATI